MAPTFFRILLVLIAAYAFWRGGRDERHIGIILVIGVVSTHLVISPLSDRFASVETHVMAVDLVVFAGFLWVALRSDRFWPMWVAGLQLTTIFGHVLKGVSGDLFPRAYGAALVFWVYPIVLILAIGTWRAHQRRRRAESMHPAL